MPTLTFNTQEFTCARAMKGADFIRLLDNTGNTVFFADGITDFNPYVLTNGAWETPLAPIGAKVSADAKVANGVLTLTPVTQVKIETGLQITFVAPCDCSEVTSLSIGGVTYYIVDTNEKPIGYMGVFWLAGTTVTLTLDCENKKAYMPSPVPDPTYNQTEILTEEVKAQFGFGADAIPNDVFAYLAKFNLHCWSKESSKEQWVMKTANGTTLVTLADVLDDTDWKTFYYGDSVSMNTSGKLSLTNEKSGKARYYGSYDVEPADIKGKYITLDHSTFYFVTGDYVFGTYRNVSAGHRRYTIKVPTHIVYAEKQVSGTSDQISSADRNAYPDNATEGNFRYTYLGVPLLNALGSLRYKMGSYVGTGTYGSSDRNTISLDFIPRIVIVVKSGSSKIGGSGTGFIYIGQPGDLSFSVNGTSLSWYASSANEQYNTSGVTYYYVALG